jgi:iron only hydrogenase large subunit-like protein
VKKYFHSVRLDEEKCRGCTNCIKRCPTEAIRVRKSKARIIDERCIDCGECLRVCPYHAKKAITDSLSIINQYKYKVAIPAPSLYGQFKPDISRNKILTALKKIGFDQVYEVSRAAEIVSDATKKIIQKGVKNKPLISSACPAVVRLIQVRFPSLINNIHRISSPMEVAAKIVRKELVSKKGLPPEDIGIFFITPCPAKVTSVKGSCEGEISSVNGTIAIKDIYIDILEALESIDKNKECEELEMSGFEGVRWANCGGEGLALGTEKFLAVDGIHNVISILEEVENDKLKDIDFIEALSCTGGCIGGPLTVENVFIARNRLVRHIDDAKNKVYEPVSSEEYSDILGWTGNIEHRPIMKLDDNISVAMKKLEELEKINKDLPGLDCGACGAPSCRALAEDIVRGKTDETDCIFKLREKVRDLAKQMAELEGKMPPVMDRDRGVED